MRTTVDMRAMAKAVLEEDDPEAALALADCVIENVNNPGFRYSAAYIEKVEEVLREVKKFLNKYGANRVKESGARMCQVPGYEIDRLYILIFGLTQAARQQFQREGV